MPGNPVLASLRTLATHNVRQARTVGDAALFRQQRAALFLVRAQPKVRTRVNKFAPRGIVSTQMFCDDRVLRPVVGVDIDGTLGDWHEMFLSFSRMYLQRTFPMRYDGSASLAEFMGVSKRTYRTVKLAFRQSGLKRAMEPLGGALKMVNAVRWAGAEVWVCTTRPYLRLDNIDPDTRWWLRHHGFGFDGVLFGEQKWRDLKSLVGGRVLGIVDDLPEQVETARRIGLPSWLLDRPHNRHVAWDWRLSSLGFAEGIFLENIEHYKKEHHVRGN
jgi:hypothetical protein